MNMRNHAILAMHQLDWEDIYLEIFQISFPYLIEKLGANKTDLKHYDDPVKGFLESVRDEITSEQYKKLEALQAEYGENTIESNYLFYQKAKVVLLAVEERFQMLLLDQKTLKDLTIRNAKIALQNKIVLYNFTNKDTTYTDLPFNVDI